MDVASLVASTLLVVEYVVKVAAVGTVPEGRNPGSSSAWLMAIFFIPVVGLPLYWMIGSPFVTGRRHDLQNEANRLLIEHTMAMPGVPDGAAPGPGLTTLPRMNRTLTGIPVVVGSDEGTYGDTAAAFKAMAEAIDRAERFVHVEFYIASWDDVTDPVFSALVAARARGVEVRFLMDHLGSRAYDGFAALQRRLTEADIDWRLMMPIQPFRGRWRRPDLRNHRKLLVVDGTRAFVGSHNLIAPSYGSERNARVGRLWKDLSIQVGGEVVTAIEAVFATDWYAETGERLAPDLFFAGHESHPPGGRYDAMQLVPSGPGFPTEPNLRMFTHLVHQAVRSVSITSPYFVPDEALLTAITSAAYRGVRVDVFVGEKADQFVVGHAQRSYYTTLLQAGVHLHLYPAPAVLHAKYMTVDGHVGVIGSSNMDYRSYALNYEVMLLGFGGDLVDRLLASDAEYLAVSRELTLDEWRTQPLRARYVDNVCRLASSLM
ncbi:phospholipase D-like domain-containing protein [Nocardioides sp. CFH 31398]|uniref:phospholipase D-like domain-containing protein n=1 Tax=Nocardioides sp. CFH 31398 TaxID=2919579 RepID=UPI001F064FCA|nr:phospholipase D-like domain-containing protein [Nocardioides sp. CFH 31398]MCH1867483.1 phospholipase D-like domain-containing protein [Nocardioides sp. CFH 31398]